MSWWSGKPPLELIDAATSEAIPSGEQNLALNLDITDLVRSKKFPADQALKAVRKRLYNVNPNVQILTLHLLDLLIKNGGWHFVEQVATKDFMDAYVAQLKNLRNQNRNPEVVDLMLEYLQLWASMGQGKEDIGYINVVYEQLRNTKGIEFPPVGIAVSGSFLHTESPPAWVDSDTCMKSGRPFTFYNRKHHCRNCGGVFLQEYCSDFLPLPHFGIVEPVRVCVDCNDKLKTRSSFKEVNGRGEGRMGRHQILSNNRDFQNNRFDQDVQRAMELSLRDSPYAAAERSARAAPSQEQAEELDEDMKAAIAASLADMEATKRQLVNTPPDEHSDTPSRTKPGPVKPAGLVDESDFTRVQEFRESLNSAQPQDAIYDEQLVGLNKFTLGLQPRIVRELTAAADKLQTLEDLHGRMMAISSYYDRLLDAELRPKQPASGTEVPRQQEQRESLKERNSGTVQQNNVQYLPSLSPTSQPLPQRQVPLQVQAGGMPSYAPSFSHIIPSAPPAPGAHQITGGWSESSTPRFPDAPQHEPALEEEHEVETAEVEVVPEPEPQLIEL